MNFCFNGGFMIEKISRRIALILLGIFALLVLLILFIENDYILKVVSIIVFIVHAIFWSIWRISKKK